jgi:hypothetical protein
MSTQKLAAYGILLFWTVMTGFFIRREVIPDLFLQPMTGFGSVRAYAETYRRQRMGICTDQGTRLGTATVVYEALDDGGSKISSNLRLRFEPRSLFPGAAGRPPEAAGPDDGSRPFGEIEAELWSEFELGPDNALRTVTATCDVREPRRPGDPESGRIILNVQASGTVRGDDLILTVRTGNRVSTEVVPVGPRDLLSSGLTPFGAFRNLRVGRSWRFATYDMFNGRRTSATLLVARRTTLNLRGHDYDLYELELTRSGRRTPDRLWVTPGGDVLRQAIGLTIPFPLFDIELGKLILTAEPLPHESRAGFRPTTSPGEAGLE